VVNEGLRKLSISREEVQAAVKLESGMGREIHPIPAKVFFPITAGTDVDPHLMNTLSAIALEYRSWLIIFVCSYWNEI